MRRQEKGKGKGKTQRKVGEIKKWEPKEGQ